MVPIIHAGRAERHNPDDQPFPRLAHASRMHRVVLSIPIHVIFRFRLSIKLIRVPFIIAEISEAVSIAERSRAFRDPAFLLTKVEAKTGGVKDCFTTRAGLVVHRRICLGCIFFLGFERCLANVG